MDDGAGVVRDEEDGKESTLEVGVVVVVVVVTVACVIEEVVTIMAPGWGKECLCRNRVRRVRMGREGWEISGGGGVDAGSDWEKAGTLALV